jgi:uncharacterized protein (DUF169 family)
MSGLRDLSIFDRFKFERKPVGVKFSITRPEGIEKLDKSLNICEMFKEAQERAPFYVTKENFLCLEPYLLGMEDPDPIFISGMIGERGDFFEDARANRLIYNYLPKFQKGSIRYVAFSSLDYLPFDPDLTIITADQINQVRILLKANCYSSGEYLSSKVTHVAACAWLYIYPVVSGEVYFTITGLSVGMRSLKVLPEGLFLISIPWVKMPMIIENLHKMKWEHWSDSDLSRDEVILTRTNEFNRYKQEIANG